MDWAVLYMRLFAGGMMFFHNIGKIQDYKRDRQLVSLFRIRRQPGRIRHRFAGRSGARHPDNHGSVGTGIGQSSWRRESLRVLLWGAPGFGTLAFTWLGVYVFLAMSGGGAVRIRHGPFPCETKKLNEENNIRSPAGRYVGGNIVTLSRFVFI
ncbi:MAG: DoxX family protein [Alistipes onderdonkii]